MAKSPPTKSSIIPFRPAARTALPVLSLPIPSSAAAVALAEAPKPSGIDLSGKKKVWFLIGRGRIGKTTVARWVAETTDARGGSAIWAAADPVNRSLRSYINGVAEPPSSDSAETKDWLRDLLGAAMEANANAVIDLGGGNTSLSALLAEMPNLTSVLTEAGIEPVAVHVIGPNQNDLVPLALAEGEGFRPAATAIILNEVHGRRDAFDAVLAHPGLKAAVDRGAIVLWMPALQKAVAELCESHAWTFQDAAAADGPLKKAPMHRADIQNWLRRMGDEMSPIASWLPE